MYNDIDSLQKAIGMAAGLEPVDTLIINAKIFDVFTATFRECPVAMGGGRFLGFSSCEAKEIIDAKGRYLIPGLIDTHIHIESSALTPARFASLVLPHGTTSVVADPHEIANVLGVLGVRMMLEAGKVLPLNVFIRVPSCVPATDFEEAGAVLTSDDMRPFMQDPYVNGVAEMMNFPGVIHGDHEVLQKILLAHEYAKPVDGHAPYVFGRELDAYVVAGIYTTHECSSLEEMDANIQRGVKILIREGTAAKNLLTLLPYITPANARHCSFCCDDRDAGDLIRYGHIDHHLRLAVAHGLDPATAILMATLNAAEATGLSSKGAIAPGRDADCVLVDDLTQFTAHQVFIAGRCVAHEGHVIVPLPDSMAALPSTPLRVSPFTKKAFSLAIPSGQARVIELMPHSLLTGHIVREVVTKSNGEYDTENNPTLTKIAVIERHKATGHIGVGLLEGYGLKGGAIASSVSHDSHNIVVAGDDDAAMYLAVQELIRLGGGKVVVKNGRVLATVPLPIAGLMTSAEPLQVSKDFEHCLNLAHDELGISRSISPFMTLSFMALPVIPSLKITTQGLFDVERFCFVDIDSLAEDTPNSTL